MDNEEKTYIAKEQMQIIREISYELDEKFTDLNGIG